ncbi:glycosyltransferase family 4 protein [Porphyromonas gingivicanis]|uniref:glycosyltransferase family 4 protein n=1 Tax=Porphyromonas gingivicanis TaxID=266762 RepID=UPI000472C9F7|nr:glycosyltransferase family 4 protein [Porphyromonas gingivicanis]
MKKLFRVATIAGSLGLLKGQLHFLSSYYDVIAVASGPERLKQVEIEEGVRTVDIPMERKISLWRDCKSLFRLIRLFRKEKPFIVHSITPKAGLLSMIAAKIARVPVRIHTFTGLLFPTSVGIKRTILIITDKITCWCATEIIPEGEGVKRDLITHRITKKPLSVIANGNVNGIDLSYFAPFSFSLENRESKRTELEIKEEDFVFVFVGRLVRDKGINELIVAFRDLNLPKTKLLLVGRYETELDPLKSETMEEIKDNPNIIEVGWQNDVRPYLMISDAMVFPSYREGFPNVVMQAGAMGLPSIVTDINGCNEIVVEGKNGLIIPPRDEGALREAMLTMIQNATLRETMTFQARPMITSRYEQNIVWDALLEEYRLLEAKLRK